MFGAGIFMIFSMLEAETRASLPFCETTGTISLILPTGCGSVITAWTLEMMALVLKPSIVSTVVKSEVISAERTCWPALALPIVGAEGASALCR